MRLSAALGSVPRLLEGKVALVTAATDGIGLGVAEALGGAGARVFLSSRRPQNVQRALERLRGRGLEVSGTTCHVGRAEDRERMVQEALSAFGAIDILVSNAAVNPHLGPALEADERTWDKVFQVNVTAAAMLIQLVVPHMERRGGGAIVVMSSIAGYQPMAGLGPYSVSKTALLGLVSALSPELLPRGIRINGVAPGLIRTRFSAAAGLPAGRGSGRAVPGVPQRRLRGRTDPAGGRGGAAAPLTPPSSSICKFMLIKLEINLSFQVIIGIGG
ncbi:dehydrogenase/reductase SDR family member 4-like 2 isoform X4 [Taeniopygia guttata]|uniref:dehydrogenase/reductase SDR family member 4-like 2 isoform X4 n=1 Tax=Taeniopygia guttata TaxID=59729 RepID=UPI003BB8884A